MIEHINVRSRAFFALVFFILLILSYLVIKPFVTLIIFTIILVIVLKPAYDYFLANSWIKGRKRLAATVTLCAFFLLIFIPLFFLVQITASQLSAAASNIDPSSVVEEIEAFIGGLQFTGDVSIDAEKIEDVLKNVAGAVASFLGDLLLDLVSSIPHLIFSTIIFLVLYITLMPVYDDLISNMEKTSPLGQEISSLYYRKTAAMVNSLVYGIFLIALIQGLAMGFFYWLAGVELVFLLVLVSIAFAILPVVGISYLTLFLAFIFVLQGEYRSAVIVLFGFYGVVNWIDVLLRPRLISKEAYTNFALVLLGILGGMIWAGFIGMFIGPTVLMLLVTTIEIYQERFAGQDGKVIKTIVSSSSEDDSPEDEASAPS